MSGTTGGLPLSNMYIKVGAQQLSLLTREFSAQGWAQVSEGEGCAGRAAPHLLHFSVAVISLNDYIEVNVN